MDDIEAIKQLKARYFRTMDTKDWSGMRKVFTDDVVMDTSAAGGDVVAGADEFLAFLQPTLQEAITVHHGHMPEIEISGPSTARGIWALQDTILGQMGPAWRATATITRPMSRWQASGRSSLRH